MLLRTRRIILGLLFVFAAVMLYFNNYYTGFAVQNGLSDEYPHMIEGCTTAFYIDSDCDGYGVGEEYVKGMDADDSDSGVNNVSSWQAKYGDIRNYLSSVKKVNARSIYYISPNGNNALGQANDSSKSFTTIYAIGARLVPGDVVLYRAGRYGAELFAGLEGERENPILIMNYPGETALFSASEYYLLDVSGPAPSSSNYLIVDGLIADGEAKYGFRLTGIKNSVLRNCEARYTHTGIIGMQNIHNLTIEKCVSHDATDEHGFYLGASSEPASNITIRNCISYKNGPGGYRGIQMNGRISDFLIENNIVHSNGGGITLYQGVEKGSVKGNMVFNNRGSALNILTYDGDCLGSGSICPYDLTNISIRGNLFWTGFFDPFGPGSSNNIPSIRIDTTDSLQNSKITNVSVDNNTIVTYDGPIFLTGTSSVIQTINFSNNKIYNIQPVDRVLGYNAYYGATDFEGVIIQNGGKSQGNIYALPNFSNASVDYSLNPELFDFSIVSEEVAGCIDDSFCADDGNICTSEVCNSGECLSNFNSNLCDDGNACTQDDVCSGGSCLGVFNSSILGCGSEIPCILTGVHWMNESVFENQEAVFAVEGENCEGKSVLISVKEKDLIFSDRDTSVNPVDIIFSEGVAYGNWSAEFIGDFPDGNPEYYLIAILEENNSENLSSREISLLEVLEAPVLCGNGVCLDENCTTCPADCGVCQEDSSEESEGSSGGSGSSGGGGGGGGSSKGTSKSINENTIPENNSIIINSGNISEEKTEPEKIIIDSSEKMKGYSQLFEQAYLLLTFFIILLLVTIIFIILQRKVKTYLRERKAFKRKS